jgi:23S rRNA pseudouridine1911/1915/1917 synthase
MTEFQILHVDPAFVVCIKPPRVVSTDEPGGVPDLCRAALGGDNFRTVHRLDQVVSGLMVLARTKRAASDLSAQIRDGIFHKEYQAVVHGCPNSPSATLRDLLWRSKPERKTYVVTEPGKDVQEAILNYKVLAQTESFSKVRIELITGRTHQIRCQFSSRSLPLVGDRKYSENEDNCEIALWSSLLRFRHPKTGEELTFTAPPPDEFPWDQFK